MKSWKRMVALSGVLMLLTGSVQGESPATLSNLPVELPEAPLVPSTPAPVGETAVPEATSAITSEPSALPSTAPASNVGTDIHGLPIPLNP